MMARQEVEEKDVKNNIMIPIAKDGKFELVPLSSLQPGQIIDYVQRQRKTEEEAELNQQRKMNLQLKEREMNEKSRKMQLALEKRDKQRQAMDNAYFKKKRNSKELIESVNQLIDEEKEDSAIEEDDYY